MLNDKANLVFALLWQKENLNTRDVEQGTTL